MRLCIFIISILLPVISFAGNKSEISCNRVKHVRSDSLEYKQINTFITNYVNKQQSTKIQIAKFRAIDSVNGWFIVEVEFDQLEPSIFVLKKNGKNYKAVSEFAGSTAPNEPKEIIVKYFIKQVPSAPKELFYCYTPKGPPFVRE